ncbi:MAG: hypothetical protein Q8862_10430 [Bacteroidota bacterium]|nr:hypothetical protein [Bacteroidota bacterium]
MRWFPAAPFMLRKDYMDFIDHQGNCFIVYWACLELFFFKFNYSALIFSDEHDHTLEKSSLRKVNRPVNSKSLFFENGRLGISGYWEECDGELKIPLYEDSAKREVVWCCHHPNSVSKITYNGRTYIGRGYAETLNLSVKPWQLPIQELRWGRYLSEKDSIIWINWKETYPVNLLYYNGVEYKDAVFETNKIVFNKSSYQLLFPQLSIVREGKLARLFSKMPWMKILFPVKILRTIEVKYKAKTSFLIDNCFHSQGWSLFEIVSWKN